MGSSLGTEIVEGSSVIEIYTDGACSGNPGPGGWAALLRWNKIEKEIIGGTVNTTNNRMELMAAIKGLEALKQSQHVNIYTDSNYVKDGITKWIHKWKSNGWKTSSKKPVRNEDLWRRLDKVISLHQVSWFWVKGHEGHPENERVDRLAKKGIPK